jgi:hypothetical protein
MTQVVGKKFGEETGLSAATALAAEMHRLFVLVCAYLGLGFCFPRA